MSRTEPSPDIISRRHIEWIEHQLQWRWMLDSLEGGERYRHAVYGYDLRGLPVRNLIRHKREYPDPRDPLTSIVGPNGPLPLSSEVDSSRDPAFLASDDDYELRRARTPVPTFVTESVETHLARIYAREVKRSGSPRITDWWSDVDGCGTTIDQWMAETVAPLLLVLGQLDLYFDHPIAPDGEPVETRADIERLGLQRCVASYILPENMLWWKLDPNGRFYLECLFLEPFETDLGVEIRYRYWTTTESTLFDLDGQVLEKTPNPFGRIPIVRVFDRRKPRCRNIGQSRYWSIAERQREYYNRDSELILSDTTQAHPLLQGPEDFVEADGTIPIGPSWLLPKKKNTQGGSATYEGFDVVDFPKDGAESIRRNKADIRDDVDRDSSLVRHTGRELAAQSGLSKMIDHADSNYRLAKLAKVLEKVERIAAELALCVIGDGGTSLLEQDAIQVVYPTEFDLFTATDVATAASEFQKLVADAGRLPFTEGLILSRLVRLCLPGLGDAQYADCDAEISTFLNHILSPVQRGNVEKQSPVAHNATF
jgi:hypothetical protein